MLLDELDAPLDDVVIGRLAIADYNESNILPHDDVTLTRLQAWIKPTEYVGDGSEFNKHVSSHLKGTSRWLFDSPIFKQWHGGHDNGILWIQGVPGTGKSVLAAKLIDHLSSEQCPVLYFFFRHTIQSNHRPEAALRDWISQILPFSPPLQLMLKNLTSEAVNIDSMDNLSTAKLWHLFRLALRHIPKAYCIVDALDEMDHDAIEQFLQLLDQLGNIHPDRVKLVVTSRPIATIEKMVRNVRMLDIRLGKEKVNPDISKYLQYRLHHSIMPSESHKTIISELLNKADGLFLYAKLAIDTISRLEVQSEEDIMQALAKMPVDLSVMYSDILREHMERTNLSEGLYILILQLVTHATRPLRLLEIADCIKVTRPHFGGDTGIIKTLIRTSCGPLLEVLPDETVRVVHHSFTEYLFEVTRLSHDQDIPVFEAGPIHNLVALLCLSYLQAGCLDSVEVPEHIFGYMSAVVQQKDPAPFMTYAANNWHLHIKKAVAWGFPQNEANEKLFSLLMTPEYTTRLAFLGGKTYWKGVSRGQNMTIEAEALHFAIHLDLTSFAESLLNRDSGDAAKYAGTEDNDPPLHQAVVKGNLEIVRFLIKHGAKPSHYDLEGNTPLHLALRCTFKNKQTRLDIVQHLLEAGADPWRDLGKNHKVDDITLGGREPHPPIAKVFGSFDETIAKLFLPYLKSEETAQKAFSWVIASSKDLNVIRLILDLGLIDINSRVQGKTLLFSACRQLDSKTVSVLLQAGADPNLPSDEDRFLGLGHYPDVKEGPNVLHALAAACWNPQSDAYEDAMKECFRFVLAAGANGRCIISFLLLRTRTDGTTVNHVDWGQQTPLHQATTPLIAQLLLDAGANPLAMDCGGEMPIHVVHSLEVMEVLLSKVNINTKDRAGRTILLNAFKGCCFQKPMNEEQRMETLSRLLDLGPDVGVVDNDGNGALHYLVEKGRQSKSDGRQLLERLIKGGADPNLRNKKGQMALQKMGWISGDLMEWLKMYLELTSVDINAVDNEGRTLLFQAMDQNGGSVVDERNGKEFMALMVDAGARFNVTDQRGRTLLHAAVRHCRSDSDLSMLHFIVEQGVDSQQTDNQGNTLWHEAMPQFATWRVSTQTFLGITALGVDPRKANNQGRAPLHVMCEYDQWAMKDRNYSKEEDQTVLFDYMLQQCHQDINCVDHDGVAPIHHLSTFSADLTGRLLEVGADPTLTTHEGLNVFHLAARCRQSNTIGLLLNWFKEKTNAKELRRVVNARDKLQRTPLYYACASGRYQSVELLINAGAVVQLEMYDGSALNGCADFEEDLKNWERLNPYSHKSDCGATLIDDTVRLKPKQIRNWTFKKERLEDILDLLVENEISQSCAVIDEAIATATRRQHDYTVECLMRTRERWGVQEPLMCAAEAQPCLERRRMPETESLRRREVFCEIEILLRLKLYNAVCPHIEKRSPKPKPEELYRVLAEVARTGHTRLLDMLLTPETVLGLEKNQDLNGNKVFQNPCQGLTTLLLAACESEEPNLSAIQLLVKKGAKPDGTVFTDEQCFAEKVHTTPLNSIVKGGQHHWWHINQALPYMLQQNVDLEVRDSKGLTPLNESLENMDKPLWHIKATEMLLQAGADPSSVDNAGKSCLARAVAHKAAKEMLLRYGATYDGAALAAAILTKDVGMVQMMLSSGTDPNTRKIGCEEPYTMSKDGRSFYFGREDPSAQEELYPLDLLINVVSRRTNEVDYMRIAEILLDHGADPNGRYPQTTVVHRILERKSSSDSRSTSGRSRYLDIVLRHPRLDVNLQDTAGVSLFQVALKMSDVEAARILIERGADVYARDTSGRNVLHLSLDHHRHMRDDFSMSPEFLKSLVALAPDLLHQTDNEGRTPLHCAADGRGDSAEEVEMLLNAGADVCSQAENGDTPLHLLFKGTWYLVAHEARTVLDESTDRVLDLFLSKRADINARNKAGETPVFNYFREGTVEAGSEAYIKKRKRNAGGYFGQVEGVVANEAILWQLMELLGVKWTVENAKGQSLLHVVAGNDSKCGRGETQSRRLRRFQFLMEKGLDALEEDVEHRTALDVAAANEAEDILALFKAEQF
ncbi:hypothetical protein F53441_8689 [Fusarium austroafricanum]|uniref:NACHT domain-containing protein n=1 Tax=Fusarium austroafricanum TaxID=2364996 RepID=A0A8H4KEJ2_9HYPO|nr:hypothetical protein F53441_8689 [Fusarium austroafricanum]